MRALYLKFATALEHRFRFDAHYFLKGGFWLSVSQGVTILAGLATTSLFAHYLSETEYGIYRYILGLAILFSSFSLTGLGQSILQTAAKKYYAFYQETLSLNLAYSLTIAILSLAGGAYYLIKENITLAFGCFLIALLQPLITGFQNTTVFLQGSRRFQASTAATTIKTLFVSLTSITALLITKDVLILIAAYLLASAVINILLHLWYRPRELAPTPAEIKTQYLSYAKHTSVRNIISNISYRADTIIVFTQLGAIELAIYTVATVIPEQIKASFKNLSSLLLPKYANSSDELSLKKSVPKRSLQLFCLLSLVVFLYILVAPYIYQIFFPKYQSAVFLSQLLSISFLGMVALIPANILQAKIATKKLYEFQMFESILSIVLMLMLIIWMGVLGAVLAKVIVRFATSIYYYILFYRS
jgi:O-antigen/teichoic acid export membrane protein